MEEAIIFELKWRSQKVESDEQDSDFECYDKSNGKPVHVDVHKEIAGRGPTFALLPNRLWEEERNNIGETRVGTVILVYAGVTEYLSHRKG